MAIKPTLLVMAAGMGSRYGGLKQIDPITEQGEIILDFSLYDALMAGFEDVVFVIKKENEEDFRALIDDGAAKRMNVKYAFQDIHDVPGGGERVAALIDSVVASGRNKPWGTGHAVLAARELISGPFAVINSDDFYGAAAFQHMYEFLDRASGEPAENAGSMESENSGKQHFSMIGYRLENTLSETGHVARGICNVDDNNMLIDITERTKIQRQPSGEIAFTEDDGKTWTPLPDDTPVSMNFWGFTQLMMDELEMHFPEMLAKIIDEDPIKGEYYLPGAVDNLLRSGKADVKVLMSNDQWYGVTYKEDKAGVMSAIRSMKDHGLYPEKIWK